jgi:cytochrome P450
MMTSPARARANGAKRAPQPERLDLDERQPLLRDIWQESARSVVRQLVVGEPQVPPGARLAPTPDEADPILGHLRLGRGDPLTSFLRWRQAKGDVVRLRLAGVTAHLLSHPRHVRWVLQEGNKRFTKPMQGRRNLSQVLGNGLLVSEGSFWLRQRRIAQPAFHKKRIRGFGERMVAAAEDVTEDCLRRAAREEPFDIAREMMRLTLRVVQETLLGATPTRDADRVGDAVSVVLEVVERRFSRVLAPPKFLPVGDNRRFHEALGVLDEAVARIIAARRHGPATDDLLSMLLEARDEETGEGMDDRQLRDEVMTIFLAGHETTANALSWTFYLLGKHPEAARRMEAEVDTVLGERAPTADDLKALPYTKAVFQEAMRLYPPAWILARAPLADEEIDGYFIPAGSRVFLSPWVIHRNPELWPDPEGFDPTRFLDPKGVDRFAYLPFGGGPRLCIGHAFAMMEGVLVLATLARRVHLELAGGHPVEPDPTITLRPKPGVHVLARAR